ncbi:MAG: hypothetical protein K5629_02205 [Eubacteriales bacterium]|nr:hypothetical protein [Eubacteriales bacterium]
MFRERIYGLDLMNRSEKNDIRLDMAFGLFTICVPNYDGCRDEVNAVAVSMIRSLFSEVSEKNDYYRAVSRCEENECKSQMKGFGMYLSTMSDGSKKKLSRRVHSMQPAVLS